jgi:hypothetical protein
MRVLSYSALTMITRRVLAGVATWRTGSGRPGCPAWTSQTIDALLPQFAAATVDSIELGEDVTTFRVRAKAGDAAYPDGCTRSSQVRSRYERELADLPLGGRRVS